jgi:ferredoxin-thioredoxin reductase catalytic subunit
MAMESGVSALKDAGGLLERLEADALAAGYHINPDREFALALCEGLARNLERYGYTACPCRLASGSREQDLDIICPCDYRDPDLEEHGACYCALYVNSEIAAGRMDAAPVPERRPPGGSTRQKAAAPEPHAASATEPTFPVWRCRVCGYLCARTEPPGTCPICKASKDRFERFM